MHAILLAAGVGRRLSDVTGGGPKCLLGFGGASLLERHLRALSAHGVHRLTIVTGCEAMQIEQALGALAEPCAPDMTIDTVQNPDFRQGSAISVGAARAVVAADTPVLLMDADVLYEPRILDALFARDVYSRLLYDRDYEAGDEPVKLALRRERVVGFDKRLPPALDYDTIGESVGFFCLRPAMAAALFDACASASAVDAQTPYERPLGDLMLARPTEFKAVDITGLAWIEIDYPDDVERAAQCVLPRLAAPAP